MGLKSTLKATVAMSIEAGCQSQTTRSAIIETAEHDLNQRVQTFRFAVFSDAEYWRQWHLYMEFNDPDYDPHLCSQRERAWSLLDHYGNEEVVIAITDNGCKLNYHNLDSPRKFASWGYFRGERLIRSRAVDQDKLNRWALKLMSVA